MQKYADKIAKLEEKIEQERQRLRDLHARATAQKRKDDTRRKILYGAALISLLEGLPDGKKRETLDRIHRRIRNAKDREFLGLPKLPAQQKAPSQKPKSGGERVARASASVTASLPLSTKARRDPTG